MRTGIVAHLMKRTLLAAGGQKGVTLVETLVALALLGILGVAFMSAISTSAITMASTEKNVDVESLARAQLEYTKNTESCPYIAYIYGPPDIPPDYTTLDELAPGADYAIAIPSSYSINVTAAALDLTSDTGIQKITVTISKDGSALLAIEGYKVYR